MGTKDLGALWGGCFPLGDNGPSPPDNATAAFYGIQLKSKSLLREAKDAPGLSKAYHSFY